MINKIFIKSKATEDQAELKKKLYNSGNKLKRTCKKLSKKTKFLYSSIFPQNSRTPDQDFPPYNPALRGPGFLSVLPIKSSQNPKILSSTYSKLSISPIKDKKSPNTRNFSPDEESEIDKIVQSRLKQQYESIKISISKKLEKLHPQVFSQDVNTIRADSLATVQMKKVEKQILPQLKREAISEIILNRKKNANRGRNEVLSEISDAIITKPTFEPTKILGQNRGDIKKICEEAQKTLRRYSVKPFEFKPDR